MGYDDSCPFFFDNEKLVLTELCIHFETEPFQFLFQIPRAQHVVVEKVGQ